MKCDQCESVHESSEAIKQYVLKFLTTHDSVLNKQSMRTLNVIIIIFGRTRTEEYSGRSMDALEIA